MNDPEHSPQPAALIQQGLPGSATGRMMEEHKEKHLKNSAFLSDVVIGMSDGLTVPFALAAGLSGAVESNGIVITAGIAEIVAGCISMGLGGFLAGQTVQEHYAAEMKREYREVEERPEVEKQEVRDALAGFGLSRQVQDLAADELSQNKDQWVKFMMKCELDLEEPEPNRAAKSAANIGLSYVVGGLIPLSAYFFTSDPRSGLLVSSMLTILCLFVFGYFKTKLTGQPPFAGALKVMLIGVAAAAAAYFVAKAFNA